MSSTPPQQVPPVAAPQYPLPEPAVAPTHPTAPALAPEGSTAEEGGRRRKKLDPEQVAKEKVHKLRKQIQELETTQQHAKQEQNWWFREREMWNKERDSLKNTVQDLENTPAMEVRRSTELDRQLQETQADREALRLALRLLDRATTPSSAPAPAPDVPHYNRPDGPGPGPHPYLPPSPPPGLPHYNRPNGPGLSPHTHLPPPPGRARQPLYYPSYQPGMPHIPPHAHNVPPVVPAVLNDDTTDTSSSGTDSDVPNERAGSPHGAGTNSSNSVVTTPTNSESELPHIPDASVQPVETPARGAVPRATVHTDVERSE